MDWNERGVNTVGGGRWQGAMIRRVLMSLGSQALRSIAARSSARPRGQGSSTAPNMIDWVGLLGDESRRPANYARPGVHPLAGLLYCGSCVRSRAHARERRLHRRIGPPSRWHRRGPHPPRWLGYCLAAPLGWPTWDGWQRVWSLRRQRPASADDPHVPPALNSPGGTTF